MAAQLPDQQLTSPDRTNAAPVDADGPVRQEADFYQQTQVIVVAGLSGILFFVVGVELTQIDHEATPQIWHSLFSGVVIASGWLNVVILYLQARQKLRSVRLFAFPLAVLYALLVGYLVITPAGPFSGSPGEFHLFFFLPILYASLFHELAGALGAAVIVCLISIVAAAINDPQLVTFQHLPLGLTLRCVLWLIVATVTGFLVREERRHRDLTARALAQANQKMRELSALVDVGRQLNSTLNMRQLLRLVIDLAAEVLRAEAGAILLVDEETDELAFEAVIGPKAGDLENQRLRLGQGIAGWVANEGEALLVPDASKDDRWYAGMDQQSGFTTRSILCVPLQSRERVIGVLELLNKQGQQQFDENDLDVCRAMAAQIVVAIENAELIDRMETVFLSTVESLSSALEFRDSETEGHSRRVRELALAIGRQIGLSDEELLHLGHGALLHDIGKIAVPDAILRKKGTLTPTEWEQIKDHSRLGWEILSRVDMLDRAGEIVLAHQERFDGTGYPRGLAGRDIPLGARVFAVADAFDAMTSDRPYQAAITISEARLELQRASGKQFDPQVVSAFMRLSDEMLLHIQSTTEMVSHDLTQATMEVRTPTNPELPLTRPPLAR